MPNELKYFRSILGSPLRFLCLFNDLIRPYQHVRWNRQADLLGGFQIDDELELFRLLDWVGPPAWRL